MKKPILVSIALFLTLLLVWGGFKVYNASKNLVTLNVVNADLRDVIRSIERQTWERVLVHTSISARVTLKVDSVPLEAVLNILGDQTSSRWNAFFPLYSSSASLKTFKQLLRGEAPANTTGWSNLTGRVFGGGGMFGDVIRSENTLVTLDLEGKDLGIATIALGRFAQARVVPEDGTSGTLKLYLRQKPMEKAVAMVAKQVKRNWDVMYALQPERGGGRRGGDREFARGEGGGGPPWRGEGEGRRGPRVEKPDDTNQPPRTNFGRFNPEMAQAMRARAEELISTLPPEERRQIEEQRQQFEQIRNLPPDQREARMREMFNNPQMQRRMEERGRARLLNTTPEQRVDRDRERNERRKEREARQAQQNNRR